MQTNRHNRNVYYEYSDSLFLFKKTTIIFDSRCVLVHVKELENAPVVCLTYVIFKGKERKLLFEIKFIEMHHLEPPENFEISSQF